MIVYRFMGKEEFLKLINGEELINNTRHYESNGVYRSRTNSKGFCFLKESDFKPEESYHFLLGVANTTMCVKFETTSDKLRKSWGIYTDPKKNEIPESPTLDDINKLLKQIFIDGGEGIPSMKIDEYCTNKYSKKDFKILEYAEPSFMGEMRWIKYEE